MLAFPFVGFVFPCFFYFLLLFFDKSSCYVLVFVFVVLGFLGLVTRYGLCFFGLFLVGMFFGGFKGQVRRPLRATSIGPKPSLFVLFCFWFVFVCFVLVVGFCLFFGFCFCFIWKGLRVK